MGKWAKKIEEITGMSETDFVKHHIKLDEEFLAGMAHIEAHGLRCLKMLNGEESWEKGLADQRKAAKRPILSENLLPDFVNKPHGEFCQSTPQAIVEPVDGGADQKTADVYKGLIYNISYRELGAAIHRDAFYNVLSSSLAVWAVGTKFVNSKSWNVEPTLRAVVNPFSVRWDLSAVKPDLSDIKWCHIVDSVAKKDFEKEYGKEFWRPKDVPTSQASTKNNWWADDRASIAEVWWIQFDPYTLYELSDGSTSREKPTETVGKDGEELRTREEYDKTIYSCVISGTEVITEPKKWPDGTEEPIIPVIIVHGRKIVVAGKIHFKAIISDGLDIQQMHNYWITAVTEAIALQPDAPYLATDAQVKGLPEWTDLSMKTRYLRYKYDPKASGPPIRQMPPQISAAVMSMPQYTRQSLRDAIGLQQASLGQTSNEKSGIAIRERKSEGDSGKYAFVENMTRGIEKEAKILVNILPSIMDTPRIERTMGVDGSSKTVFINQEDPNTKEVISLDNGKYDVKVSIGPMFSTQREEAKNAMIQLVQYLGPIAPAAVTAISPKFMKLINAPDADEIAKIIIATLPPQIQAFYKTEEGDNAKMSPEVMAQVQALQQQLQQIGQVANEQAAKIAELEREEKLAIAKLENSKEIEKEKIQLRREEIVKEITLKREELKQQKEIALEKLEAEAEIKMRVLMETLAAQKEIKDIDKYIMEKKGAKDKDNSENEE